MYNIFRFTFKEFMYSITDDFTEPDFFQPIDEIYRCQISALSGLESINMSSSGDIIFTPVVEDGFHVYNDEYQNYDDSDIYTYDDVNILLEKIKLDYHKYDKIKTKLDTEMSMLIDNIKNIEMITVIFKKLYNNVFSKFNNVESYTIDIDNMMSDGHVYINLNMK